MNSSWRSEMEHEKRMENRWYIIYRISTVFDSDTYIGCTFNTVAQRFNQHVVKSKMTDTKLARKIRDIGRENLSITDLYSRWMTINDAREIERGLIDLLEPSLNMLRTGGFRNNEDGSWDETEYKKDWYLQNKERISDRDSTKISCNCGATYTHGNKARHFKTQRHLSRDSVFSASPGSPVPLPPLINPDDDPACHSE